MPKNQPDQNRLVEAGRKRLNLISLRKLEYGLGISRAKLQSIAENAEAYYSPFPKAPKIRPFQKKFKANKERIIDNPIEPLRDVQKRIQHRLLTSLDMPYYLCGGVKDRSLLDNVTIHHGAPVLVAVDIKAFFPSIRDRTIYKIWTDLLGCSAEIASLLTRLTTRQRHLPQGSSTSTMLANLVLFSIDAPIRAACEKHSVRYSSWVDDLAFSGANSREVLPIVIQTLRNAGFQVSRGKIRVMGRGTRKVLNGILLGRFPAVLPERIAQLRSGIHKLKTGQVHPEALKNYIAQLGSSIAQVGSIDPRKGERLQSDFDNAVRELRLS